MIVVLAGTADDEAERRVCARAGELGLETRALRAGPRRLVHVTRGPTRRARRLLALAEVEALVPTSGPRVRREGRRFYPYHTLRMGAVLLVLLGVLVLASGFLPPGGSADWPWYVLPLRGLLRLVPGWPGLALALGGLVLVLALPLLDRGAVGRRAPVLVLGLALGSLLLGLGLWEELR